MGWTVFVCAEHEHDPMLRHVFHYVLSNAHDAEPRRHPTDPSVDLSHFGITPLNPDLIMDAGL